MTYKDWRKALKQLKEKPVKKDKYLKHNAPKQRKDGIALFKCRRCGRSGGHINMYGLHLCRHCFRELAQSIGFKKYN